MNDLNIIERWEKSGLLEGLDENKSELIANALEIILKHLLERQKENNCSDVNGEFQIFPILRRILSNIDVEINELNTLVLDIYSVFIKTSYNLIVEFTKDSSLSIDYELEIVTEFCDNYIKNYNEKTTK